MVTTIERTCFACLAAAAALVSPAGAVVVGTVAELENAVAAANAGGDRDIALRDGTYTLNAMLWIDAAGVTMRSLSGERDAVVVRGQGMGGGVSHVFNVNGDNFTVRDLTMRDVANHAVQLQVGVDGLLVRNCHILDTYEQMIKVAYDPARPDLCSDNGIVEYCLLEYRAGIGPQYYIGGVDVHNGKNWVVRHNVFRGIRSPSGDVAEYAVHFWSGCEDPLVEGNLVINCDRGIGFGMYGRGNVRGVIRNNMVYHDASAGFADVGIAVEDTAGARVYNNTVFQEHGYPNAIEYRFSGTTGAYIANNITNRAIAARDGARGTETHNANGATAAWFAGLFVGDLHLAYAVATVVDQGTAIVGLVEDIDGGGRPYGAGIDIGADEYGSGTYDPIPGPPTPPGPGGDLPIPSVFVNGSGGPVELGRGAAARVTVRMDPGAHAGQGADWWMAAQTPGGLLFFTFDGWTPEGIPAHRGPLFDLAEFEVFAADSSTLAPGTYIVHFGADLDGDGALSWGSLVYDSVQVEID